MAGLNLTAKPPGPTPQREGRPWTMLAVLLLGQFMALLAAGIHDANGETLAAYNAYSPSTAQGAGLSSVVFTRV